MLIKRFVLAMLMTTFLFCGGRVLEASVVNQFFSGERNVVSDDSGDYLFNRAGSPATLDIGDVLIAAFKFNTIEGLGTGTVPITNEFTGLAVIEVANKGAGGSGFVWDFAPVSAAALTDLTNGVAGGNPSPLVAAEVTTWASGSMAKLYDGGSVANFTRQGPTDDGAPGDIGVGPFADEEALVSTAIDGLPVLELGFTGLAGSNEYWTATAFTDNIGTLGGLPVLTSGGQFGFGLNVAVNYFPLLVQYSPIPNSNLLGGFFGDPLSGTSQWVGSGELIGKDGVPTPYDSWDRFDATFAPTIIPEPASVLTWSCLVGIAILAGVRRRRRKN